MPLSLETPPTCSNVKSHLLRNICHKRGSPRIVIHLSRCRRGARRRRARKCRREYRCKLKARFTVGWREERPNSVSVPQLHNFRTFRYFSVLAVPLFGFHCLQTNFFKLSRVKRSDAKTLIERDQKRLWPLQVQTNQMKKRLHIRNKSPHASFCSNPLCGRGITGVCLSLLLLSNINALQ